MDGKKNYDKEMNFGINMCMLIFFEYEWWKMKKLNFLIDIMNV